MKPTAIRFADHSMARNPLSHYRNRSGFTLIEALVAITVTLIMMLALSKGFVMMSQSISDGRSKLALSDQLRGISMTLREDLSGMTAGGDPSAESNRSGYFEYYEGPISDYTAALVNFDQTQVNLEQKNPASRYGDFDDILAFTAKAKKGQWFYGEVPYPMVMGPAQMAAGTTPSFVAEDWARTVTVASDTAEIVYFMMPYAADPAQFPLNTLAPPSVNFIKSAPTDTFALNLDLTPSITESATAVGVPARMILCRRVLLVLPDLNMPAGTPMPGGLANTLEPTLFHQGPPTIADPSRLTQLNAMTLGSAGSANSYAYRFGLQMAHQRCDLSVRRASDGDTTNPDPIAANTLADLQDPKNRFAHTVLPVGSTTATTMPIWSLTGPIPLQSVALSNNTSLISSGMFDYSVVAPNQELPELGFLLPQFMRQRRTDPPVAGTPSDQDKVTFEMAFSEVLTNNCIAFDVKGYDPELSQWYHPGIDGVQAYGAPGSDDVIVNPGDPGYSNVMTRLFTNWNAGSTPPSWSTSPDIYVARTGGFANLGWPLTLRATAFYENAKIGMTPPKIVANNNDWVSEVTTSYMPQLSSSLSLTYPGAMVAGHPPFTLYAQKSGKVVSNAAGLLKVYQPTFDTFTDRYDVDGYLQSNLPAENGNFIGTIWVDGQHQFEFPSNKVPFISGTLPSALADRGANGIDDNNVAGVDDVNEKDATPPINSPLKAVQITIRVEDKGANVIQQVVVDHELRLEN